MKRFTALQIIVEPKTVEPGGPTYGLRTHYEYEWPQDLPKQCDSCGAEFRVTANLQFGHGRKSKIMKKLSKCLLISSLIICFVAVLIVGIIPNSFVLKNIHWVGYLAFAMFLTSLVLFYISIFMPHVRHLKCRQCDWNRDYPIMRNRTGQTKN